MERYPFIMINTDIPLVCRFDPNPNSVSFPSKKVFEQTRTISGYVFEHWGKEPMSIAVSGIFKKDTIETNNASMLSEAVYNSKFFLLRQMYEFDKRKVLPFFSKSNPALNINNPGVARKLANTIILYRGTVYNGFFESFTYSDTGENPFHLRYDFVFKVIYTSEDFLRDAALKSGAGAAVLGVFGLAQSATEAWDLLNNANSKQRFV